MSVPTVPVKTQNVECGDLCDMLYLRVQLPMREEVVQTNKPNNKHPVYSFTGMSLDYMKEHWEEMMLKEKQVNSAITSYNIIPSSVNQSSYI